MPRVGICFSTHNRQDVLNATLDAVKSFTPPEFPVVVVDDGSTPPAQVPDWVHLVRHDTPQGIAATKNRGIAELYDRGVDEFLIMDDDTRPAAADWWRPYIDGAEQHYSYCWSRFAKDKRPVPKMDVIYRAPDLIGYGWGMGCLLYATRHVIDRVGGMLWEFGSYEEHGEWSQRIHNCGFTTFTFQDHPQMRGKIWAGDEHYAVKRSFEPADRNKLLARNEKLRLSRINSTDYVEFRQPRDVILTSYFTGQVDPQRHRRATPDPTLLRTLMRSTKDHTLVVLHDQLSSLPPRVEGHKVPAPLCAYQQRWISQYAYLRAHPEIRWVWMVDATDTQLLHDPWTRMQPGTLFVGYEPIPLDCDWIRKHCPPTHKKWVDQHANEQLLNTGIVGGDRATVMRLCRRMNDLWVASDRKNALYEMLLFNVAAREFDYVTGPDTVTLFKSNAVNDPTAIWRHK